MDFEFSLPKSLSVQINASYKICYEVLDDVLADILDIHIVEPSSFFQNVLKIKPIKSNQIQICIILLFIFYFFNLLKT
jgi:hypothetical protein